MSIQKLIGIDQNLSLFYPRRLNLSLKVNIKDQPKLDVCFVVPFQLVLFFGCFKPFISTLLHAPHLLTSAPFTHVTAQLHRTNSSFFNPKKKSKSTQLIHNIKKQKTKKKKHQYNRSTSTKEFEISIGFLFSLSAMADRFRAFCKDEILTYAYLLLYIALSSGQIFFNKVLLLLLVFCVIALLIINQVFVTEKELQFCFCVFGFGDINQRERKGIMVTKFMFIHYWIE